MAWYAEHPEESRLPNGLRYHTICLMRGRYFRRDGNYSMALWFIELTIPLLADALFFVSLVKTYNVLHYFVEVQCSAACRKVQTFGRRF